MQSEDDLVLDKTPNSTILSTYPTIKFSTKEYP